MVVKNLLLSSNRVADVIQNFSKKIFERKKEGQGRERRSFYTPVQSKTKFLGCSQSRFAYAQTPGPIQYFVLRVYFLIFFLLLWNPLFLFLTTARTTNKKAISPRGGLFVYRD